MDIRSGILSTAQALGVDPLDLATIISYETAGTFDPAKRGPTTQWGQHRGLIQFGEPQAQQHGVDWSDPLGSQLGPNGAVASYFRASGAKPGMGLLDLYSIVNAGGPGLYNRTDENNGGAPGTVRDKVENQMSGHRRNAERLFGGETLSTNSPAIATAGLALTPSLIPGMDQEAPQMEPETAGGLLGMLFPDMGADRADQIRLGLAGLSRRPNQAYAQTIQARMGERAQGRERQEQAAQAQQQANKTIAAMRQGGAPDYLIAAAEAGQVMPAFQEFLKLRAAQMQGQEPTALMQNVEFIMQQNPGISMQEALQLAKSGTTVNVNSGSEVGTIPPGHELFTDPETGARRMRPIAGSPAYVEQQQAAEQAQSAQQAQSQQQQTTDNVVLNQVNAIRGMLQDGGMFDLPEAGIVGNALGAMGVNQEAVNMRNRLATLEGMVSFDQLAKMRDASPTGGALGAISERELTLLSAQLGTLKQSSDPATIMETLDLLESVMRKADAYPNAAQFGFGGASEGGPRVKTYNPQTGRLE